MVSAIVVAAAADVSEWYCIAVTAAMRDCYCCCLCCCYCCNTSDCYWDCCCCCCCCSTQNRFFSNFVDLFSWKMFQRKMFFWRSLERQESHSAPFRRVRGSVRTVGRLFFTHTLSIKPRVAAQAPVVGCRVLRLLDFFLTRKTQHLSPSHRRVELLKQLVKDFNGKSKLLLLCSLYVILRNCDLNEHAISFKFSERCWERESKLIRERCVCESVCPGVLGENELEKVERLSSVHVIPNKSCPDEVSHRSRRESSRKSIWHFIKNQF